MLNQVDFPLTNSQISEFILDKGYTTYFRLQSALAELTDSGLLKIELTHNRTLYNLTEEGAATINYFTKKSIPYLKSASTTEISAPSTTETATTAVVCLASVFLSGQTIFLNSALSPLNQLFF